MERLDPPTDSGGAPDAPQPRWKRRIAAGLAGLVLLSLVLFGRPAWHVAQALWRDVDAREPLPQGEVDDASRLNQTPVAEVWPVPADTAAAEAQLAQLLRRAAQQGLRVSIAGARHSMGGHTIFPGGIAVDMLPFNHLELDESAGLLHAGSGARWSEIIPYLDRRGRSVAVMQSNNSFSVGGSISVNCHGWQFGRPPISSTVDSFRLMKADGSIVRCSREENRELFSLALGGYGLFGVILDVDLRVVPNERYRLEQFLVPTEEALETFDKQIRDRPEVAMAYARMGIIPHDFLGEVIINVLERDPATDGAVPPLHAAGLSDLRRSLFRGSVGSDYGKQLRWQAETKLQPHLRSRHFSRNQLLNEGVDLFQNRTAGDTDILHEYFIPPEGVARFVASLAEIISRHKADLLNVTIRSVDTDDDTFLRYADRRLFSFVMLFNQQRTAPADAAMQELTGELIDAALAEGGRYYLPYRLHATPEQFRRAYPQAGRFFALKRTHDPHELFQNRFYEKYGTMQN